MMIDKDHYQHYWDKGWVVVEGVFDHGQIDQVVELAMEVSHQQLGQDDAVLVDTNERGAEAPRKIVEPFLCQHCFRDFAMNRTLQQIIAQLLGGEPLLVMDQIFMKPPHFGSAKPYHQDNAYFQVTPADRVLTAWIALDDVDAKNGCLRYIERSHLGDLLPHVRLPDEPHNKVPPPELIDLSKEVLAIVKKGGVVFHHSKQLHTSHRNHSDRWRRAYATHWVMEGVTCETETLNRAYYRREDYPG